jgi:hypothetical protein
LPAIVELLTTKVLVASPQLKTPPTSRASLSVIVESLMTKWPGRSGMPPDAGTPKFWMPPESPPPYGARLPEIRLRSIVRLPERFATPPPE